MVQSRQTNAAHVSVLENVKLTLYGGAIPSRVQDRAGSLGVIIRRLDRYDWEDVDLFAPEYIKSF
jgi:hypothetical protein